VAAISVASTTPVRIIEHVNIMEHDLASLSPGFKAVFYNCFVLQRTRKMLTYGIIIAVSLATHAGLNIERFKQFPYLTTGIL
jgi:hypothetical protein